MLEERENWLKQRLGNFTASKDAYNLTRTPRSKSQDYWDTVSFKKTCLEKATERFMGVQAGCYFNSQALDYRKTIMLGKNMEQTIANSVTEYLKGNFKVKLSCEELQKSTDKDLKNAGASCDGFLTDNDDKVLGIVEIKNRTAGLEHFKYFAQTGDLIIDNALLKKESPENYWQIQMQMLITNTNFCLYFRYYSGLDLEGNTISVVKDPIKKYNVNISLRDEEDIAFLRERLIKAEELTKELEVKAFNNLKKRASQRDDTITFLNKFKGKGE